MFPFFLPYCNTFCTCMFISLVLYAFLILIIALRESVKVITFEIFESIVNCVPLRIVYNFAIKIKLVFDSLYKSLILIQIIEAPTFAWLFEESVYVYFPDKSQYLFFSLFLKLNTLITKVISHLLIKSKYKLKYYVKGNDNFIIIIIVDKSLICDITYKCHI